MLAVAGVILTNMIVGMLWYGPLFGKKWMRLVGMSEKDLKKGSIVPMIAALIGAALTAFIFGVITTKIGVDNLRGYIETAFWIWLGFTAIPSFVNASFSGKSKQLWGIEVSHWLVSMMLMGLVFSLITL